MEKPFISTAPARLYSMLLKLRPLERGGSLMPFSGELVHGAWLHWMRKAAPDISSWLHDGNRRRLFTCSSLQFPLPFASRLKAERDNRHLTLDIQQTYTIRITLLLGELFPLFYKTLLETTQDSADASNFLIGRQRFMLDSLILDAGEDESGWSGSRTFQELVDEARQLKLGKISLLELEFASLTTFNWLYLPDKTYGNHYARLPLPHYIFQGLASRWQELAPPELNHVIRRDRIEAYVQAEGIVIDDYNLQTHQVQFAAHPQHGFVGSCKYLLRGPDTAFDDSPLTIRQQIYLLSQLAFYTGVGYKPAMGMGQVRILL